MLPLLTVLVTPVDHGLAAAAVLELVPAIEQAQFRKEPLVEPIAARPAEEGADLRVTLRELGRYELRDQTPTQQVVEVGDLEEVAALFEVLRQLLVIAPLGLQVGLARGPRDEGGVLAGCV